MTTLHTVSKSPHASRALESCLAHLSPGDAVLLIEDGVLAARAGAPVAARLAGLAVFALDADVKARGITGLAAGVTVVDDAGFVELAVRHARSQAWF